MSDTAPTTSSAIPASFGPIEDFPAWCEAALEHIDGRPLVVSVSGGKDSAAVMCLLRAAGIPFQAIHMDTGWESEITESYVRDYLPAALDIEIEILGYPGGMEALIERKGMFPSRQIRTCTHELKVEPATRYFAGLIAQGLDPINVVGIRREEGTTTNDRGTALEWEHSKQYDCEVWRPLVTWTLKDVVDAHDAWGVKPNPLYIRGADRVGCWPCIFVTKPEIRLIAETDPERIERMRVLEREVGDAAYGRELARTMAAVGVLRSGGSYEEAQQAAIATMSQHSHAVTDATWERMFDRIDRVMLGETDDFMLRWNAPTWFQARISKKTPTNEFRCNGKRCLAKFTAPVGDPDCPDHWKRAHASVKNKLQPNEVDAALKGWLREALGPDTAESLLPGGAAHREGCGVHTWRRHITRSGEPWSIDRVVEWSRTKRGGKVADDLDADLFAAREHERGCARFGFCEVPLGKGTIAEWTAEAKAEKAEREE